jgi:hypothetical protein
MSGPSNGPREPDDAMARQSGQVSEDVQPVATDEDPDATAQGTTEDPRTAERTAGADDLGPE